METSMDLGPILDIIQPEIGPYYLFFDRIVSKIFRSRRAWCIRKFRLSCHFEYNSRGDKKNFSSVLCAVVERSVEELELFIQDWCTSEGSVVLPPSLFCCKTLVVLKLQGDIVISPSSSVHLPNLKVLHLIRVKYKGKDTVCNLFSGCPVLDYVVVVLGYYNWPIYEISSLTVRHLFVCVEFWHSVTLKITVNAPAAEYLSICYGRSPFDLVLENVSNSVHAEFDINPIQPLKQADWDSIKGIFGALCNVQFLTLKYNIIRVSDHHFPIDDFPRFDNLVELKVIGFGCFWPLLLDMLLNCPRLEHLTISANMGFDSLCEERVCWICPQQVPHCLEFYLTMIKFEGFEGLEAEMEFIQYVLINSGVLRNMTVSYRPKTNLGRKFGAFQEISMFEKQSTRCQLNFEQQLW